MRMAKWTAVVGLWLGGMPVALSLGTAHAQGTAGMGTTNGLPPGYATNPFASPYANPLLNPYAAAAGPVSRDQLLLYALAARQQGQVNRRAASAEVRPPAQMPYHLMRPGGTTSGSYFNRTRPVRGDGSSAPANGGYFARHGQYFRNNGR